MKPLLFVVALALTACAKPAAAPATVAQSCPAAPRYLTAEDLKAMSERELACGADQACKQIVQAEYADAVVAMSTLFETSKAGSEKSGAALRELQALETQACACRDADCANRVQEDFEAWAERHADTKGSQAEADQAGTIAEHISECMMKAMNDDSSAP